MDELQRDYDAICLTIGAETPRDLRVPGRVLSGIELAMHFLAQQNRRDAGATIDPAEAIDARDKHVVIIGGGDTGSDCAGTCVRQGARECAAIRAAPATPGGSIGGDAVAAVAHAAAHLARARGRVCARLERFHVGFFRKRRARARARSGARHA